MYNTVCPLSEYKCKLILVPFEQMWLQEDTPGTRKCFVDGTCQFEFQDEHFLLEWIFSGGNGLDIFGMHYNTS